METLIENFDYKYSTAKHYKDNIASHKAFLKAGYKEWEKEDDNHDWKIKEIGWNSKRVIDGNHQSRKCDISHGERVYLYLTKQRLVVGGGMFVRNVIRRERQHEFSMHIT